MLKLYGFPLSNYFNMVKIALLEKGVDFEIVNTMPNQDGDYLAKSPMGKVPCLETDQGFLSETDVILNYLDDAYPEPAFLPSDPYERAKVRELMKELELYVELPARTCFPEAFFGGSVSDEVKEKAKAAIEKGVACIRRNAKFSPFLAGDQLTYADFFYMYSMSLASACGRRIWKWDPLEDFPEATALMQSLNERESAGKVAEDQKS
jgi:glutathione S-transferase